uniref:Uncharacterized protein n=1 Tax=Cyanistes caeruleus TaxID=156563 RepID=A0A8C0U273_CYACU
MLRGLCCLPGPLLALGKPKPTLGSADHSKNNLSWAVCNQVPPPWTPSDGFYRGITVWLSLCGQREADPTPNPNPYPQSQPVMVRHSCFTVQAFSSQLKFALWEKQTNRQEGRCISQAGTEQRGDFPENTGELI